MTVEIEEKLDQLVKREGLKREVVKKLRELVAEAGNPWDEARSMLRRKAVHPLRYQRKLRREWEA